MKRQLRNTLNLSLLTALCLLLNVSMLPCIGQAETSKESLYSNDSKSLMTKKKKSKSVDSEFKTGLGASENFLFLNLDLGISTGDFILYLVFRKGLELDWNLFSKSYPKQELTVYGLTIGSNIKAGIFYLAGSAGLAYMTGTLQGDLIASSGSLFSKTYYYSQKNLSVLCFPIRLETGLKFGVIGFSFSSEILLNDTELIPLASLNLCFFLD